MLLSMVRCGRPLRGHRHTAPDMSQSSVCGNVFGCVFLVIRLFHRIYAAAASVSLL